MHMQQMQQAQQAHPGAVMSPMGVPGTVMPPMGADAYSATIAAQAQGQVPTVVSAEGAEGASAVPQSQPGLPPSLTPQRRRCGVAAAV